MLRFKIVLYFIYYCLVSKTKPWRFFQLNAKYFNEQKGIYSKYEIEQCIPEKWRLDSYVIKYNDSIDKIPNKFNFPVFLKPEWGQNSHGIKFVESEQQMKKAFKEIKNSKIPYMIQSFSKYENEYEILYTRNPIKPHEIIVHSIIESKNLNPKTGFINGIYGNTTYHEIKNNFSPEDLEKITSYIKQIGEFGVARIGLKSNDEKSIIKGDFEIFEINIFIPMSLNFFDENISAKDKNIFLKKWTHCLAQLTKNIPKKSNKLIFFRKISRHLKIKLHHNKYYMKFKKIFYGFIEDKFMHGCSDYNSLAVRKASCSKKQSRDMFEKNNIPYAKGTIFFSPMTAYRFVKKHGFPVCIKPNVGGYSRGSHFPINTWKDFWKACFLVKVWWPVSVVEKYLDGKNYRIVITKTGGIEIAMQRYPAFVIGDSENTIGELIDIENKIREDMNLLPVIHKIEKSVIIKSHLKKQSLDFESILEKDKRVFLYHKVSLAPGGVLKTVDVSTITKKNKEIFLKTLTAFDSNIFGVDVIMEKGVNIDFDKQKCIFLELNSRPYLEMHNFPRYGKIPDMSIMYKNLDKLEVENRGIF